LDSGGDQAGQGQTRDTQSRKIYTDWDSAGKETQWLLTDKNGVGVWPKDWTGLSNI